MSHSTSGFSSTGGRADLPSEALRDLRDAVAAAAAKARDPRPFDPHALDRRDPELVARLLPLFEGMSRNYLRLSVEGAEHVTPGRALYVANHNGGIMGPDLFCTLATLWRRLGPEHPLYALAHDFAMRRVTPLGRVLQGVGAMRAGPDSARRALSAGHPVLVYPGGDLDAYRSFARRDRVVFGRRTGFVRLAREAGVPIVPVVAHGAHRSGVILHEGEWIARALGLTRWSRLTRFPIALALPWGVAAGPWMPYLPLPFPIRLRVLPPIHVSDTETPESGRDRVVGAMQRALDEMAAASRGATR